MPLLYLKGKYHRRGSNYIRPMSYYRCWVYGVNVWLMFFDDFGSFDILQGVVEEIAKRGDRAIFTAFEKYGYSKDYLVSHANEFRVERWLAPDSKTFYHGNEKLFTVYKITDFNNSSMYSFSYQLDFYVIYHKKI